MQKSCPRCSSPNFTIGAGTLTHYASVRCQECDRFIRWLPHPKNHEAHNDENVALDRLLASDLLTDWERQFCQNIKNLEKRSPRQKATLLKIVSTHLLNQKTPVMKDD